MKISEEFTVPSPPETVWKFFEDVSRVVRCLPGVQEVHAIAPDRYRVVITQKVGFISATFEVKTQLERREPPRLIEFSSVGKTIHGAIGNVRSKDRVELEPDAAGGSRIRLVSEVALGGMLGSLGEKIVVLKSREVMQEFAKALRSELGGSVV